MAIEGQEFYLYALIFLVIHTIGLMTAMHAVLNVRTSQGAIAWSLALVLLPYIAVPFYWIFGPRRFLSYMSELDKAVLEQRERMKEFTPQLVGNRTEVRDRESQILLEDLTQMPITLGNSLHLFIDGKEAFNEIFSTIRSARKYILIEFYIVRDDSLGKRLRDLLILKASEGVQIYFLADSIGSLGLDQDYAESLRRHGIHFEWFGSKKRWPNRFHINFRNHRKIVVIDGEVGFTGGLNVGEEYLGLDENIGPWRDTHLKLEGPALLGLQSAFFQDWSWAGDSQLEIEINIPVPHKSANTATLVISTSPADRFDTGMLLMMHLLSSATDRLWIATPYFVPDEGIISLLQVVALRGVDVRILLPSNPDHIVMGLASWTYFEDLIDAGVKIYRYGSGFMHQKVVLVDGDFTSIGTLNMDNRSLRLNFEISVVSFSLETASELANILEDDFASSDLLVLEELKRRSLGLRIIGGVCRLFAPIL